MSAVATAWAVAWLIVVVFSRGLALPGPAGAAGRNGFGWQPLAVGLLAWAVGLRVGRPTRVPAAA
jgi:hypothetical protein